MDADKGKSTSWFYHPFAALPRATEDTEEKREKTFKDLDLGLNPRTGSWFKISSVFIRVHLRLKGVKGVVCDNLRNLRNLRPRVFNQGSVAGIWID